MKYMLGETDFYWLGHERLNAMCHGAVPAKYFQELVPRVICVAPCGFERMQGKEERNFHRTKSPEFCDHHVLRRAAQHSLGLLTRSTSNC